MEYLIHIGILISIYSILTLSLNLAMGEAGLLSVTHAAFYGLGAYATALLMITFGMNFFVAVVLAMILSGLIALVLGFIFARLKEVYYVFGTIGFNYIIFSIFLNWDSLTRGPLGIPGIPRPELFGFTFSQNISFLLLSIALAVLTFAAYRTVMQSSYGRVLNAIREDEEAISVFGYATLNYKLFVLVLSGAGAALAGSLYATYISYIDPTSFTVNESIFILAMVILGGLGSARGAVLGAALLIILPEALRFVGFPSDIAAQMRQVVYGLLLIGLMIYRPQGILGRFRM